MDRNEGLPSIPLIKTKEEVLAILPEIANSPYLAFDTEFIRENTFFPILEILQVATLENCWLIDAQEFRKKPDDLKPLLDLFTSPDILKIAHSAPGDQECLISAFGIAATPLFDTAIGASLSGFGEGIGLGNLLKMKLGIAIEKGHARTNWSARPLQDRLLRYALEDVKYLAKLGVGLLEDLEALGRKEWALSLSAKLSEFSTFYPEPLEMAARLVRAGRVEPHKHGALLELMKWREKRVRELNIPRRWLADDSVLLDLTHTLPRDLSHLGTFRGLSKPEIQKQGKNIIQAIETGLENKGFVLPKLPAHESTTSSEEARTLELLRCFMSLLCDRDRIALKHVASAHQLVQIMRAHPDTLEKLKGMAILSQPACDLIGQELLDFLHGKKGLTIRSGQVDIIEHQ